MNIVIQLSHPAQFHLFKNVIVNLTHDGYNVHILIKTKDILEDLLKESGFEYYNVLRNGHRKSKVGVFWDMVVRDCRIVKFCRDHDIDLLMGSTVEVAHVAWLLRKKSINFGEDDMSVVPAFRKIGGPFIQTMLSPVTCNNGELEKKTVHYQGFHKLAYLHPNWFMPNKKVVERYFPTDEPYFILRFAKLNAYHDLNVNTDGLCGDVAKTLISMLEAKGRVFITSERELEPDFEKYRLIIEKNDIHHVLAFATMLVGDSQSMAVEAAMLGTPSIRFNSFAGRIGVLEELENKYGLTFGINSAKPEMLYSKIIELLAMPNLRDEFQQRRQKMLADKIDVTAFFTWFIENYPESRKIMKENPDYQYRFK